MKIVLIGAPGSGKGTLAAGLERRFGLKHLSFGQIVRGVAKTNPRVKALIDGGNMIDDALAKEILTGRINQPDCQNGFILDGFPRSLAQAKMLKEIMEIDFAIYLKISESEIFRRLGSRLSCPNCNAVYSKQNYNKDVCQTCGAKLEVRADDTTETIKKRIEIFNANVKDLLKFYKNQLLEIDAEGTPEAVVQAASNLIMKE